MAHAMEDRARNGTFNHCARCRHQKSARAQPQLLKAFKIETLTNRVLSKKAGLQETKI